VSDADRRWLLRDDGEGGRGRLGSRAHGTRSTRSDIDLFVLDPAAAIDDRRLYAWRLENREERGALDFFISHDRADSAEGQMATSAIDGSVLPRRRDFARGLGAVLLWSDGALSDHGGLAWTHDIDAGTEFAVTIIPTNFSGTLSALPGELNRLGLPNTFLDSDWGEGGTQLRRGGEASLRDNHPTGPSSRRSDSPTKHRRPSPSYRSASGPAARRSCSRCVPPVNSQSCCVGPVARSAAGNRTSTWSAT